MDIDYDEEKLNKLYKDFIDKGGDINVIREYVSIQTECVTKINSEVSNIISNVIKKFNNAIAINNKLNINLSDIERQKIQQTHENFVKLILSNSIANLIVKYKIDAPMLSVIVNECIVNLKNKEPNKETNGRI